MKYQLGKVYNLGSSSEGNAFYVELLRKDYPRPFKLLIECGFDYNTLTHKLLNKGISLNDIDAILITHAHGDHEKAILGLAKRGKVIYAPQSVYDKYKITNMHNKHVMYEHETSVLADKITVYGFPLDHESDDGSSVYNLGYIITVDESFKILFVTDTKYIRSSENLDTQKFNVIFIEANNLTRVIYASIKTAQDNKDTWKQMHFERVLHSHMLVENTAKTLASFDLSKTYTIILIHLTANSIANNWEFKDIVKNKIRGAHKFRKVMYINKKKEAKSTTMPRILIATKDGRIE